MRVHVVTSDSQITLVDLARKFHVDPQSILVRNPHVRSIHYSGAPLPPATFGAPPGPRVSSFDVVVRNDHEMNEVLSRKMVVAAIHAHCGRLHREGEVVGVPQLLLPEVQDADTTLPVLEEDTKLSEVLKTYNVDINAIRDNGGFPCQVAVFGTKKKTASKKNVEYRAGTFKELEHDKSGKRGGVVMAAIKNIKSSKRLYNQAFHFDQVILPAATRLPMLTCNYEYVQSRPDYRMSRIRRQRHIYSLPAAFQLPGTRSEVREAPLPTQGVAKSDLLRGHNTVGIHTIVASRGVDVHIVTLFEEVYRVLVFVPGAANVNQPIVPCPRPQIASPTPPPRPRLAPPTPLDWLSSLADGESVESLTALIRTPSR